MGQKCAGCGCDLEPYEVFAARIRGLKKPVCMGCAFEVIGFLKEHVFPMLEEALTRLVEREKRCVSVGSMDHT